MCLYFNNSNVKLHKKSSNGRGSTNDQNAGGQVDRELEGVRHVYVGVVHVTILSSINRFIKQNIRPRTN